MNIKYIIKRYELVGEPPTKRVVGIQLECDENERKEYAEAVLSLDECDGKNESEICNLAYKKISPTLKQMQEHIETFSPILGSEFIPPENDI